MATGTTGVINNNREYLFRLQTLIIDGGTEVIRNIFDQRLPGVTLSAFLTQEKNAIKILKRQKTITKKQYDLLYPTGRPPNSTDFDITLIICLLRNVRSLGLNQSYPWNIPPQSADLSLEADLCRLKGFRNEVAHISSTKGFQQTSFNVKWTDIEQVFLRLNTTVPSPLLNFSQTIDNYKYIPLDAAAEQKNKIIIEQWRLMERSLETEMLLIKDDVKTVSEDVIEMKEDVSNTKQGVTNIEQDVRDTKHVVKSIEQNVSDTKQGIKYLAQNTRDMKQGVQNIERDVRDTKDDVESIEQVVIYTRQDVKRLEQKVNETKEDVHVIKQQVDVIITDISIIKQEKPSQEEIEKLAYDKMKSSKQADLYDQLNPDWAPTVKMGRCHVLKTPSQSKSRYKRSLARSTNKLDRAAASALLELSCVDPDLDGVQETGTASQTDVTCSLLKATDSEVQRLQLENAKLQKAVDSQKFDEPFFLGDDTKVKYYTGLTNFSVLKALYDYVEPDIQTTHRSALNKFQQLLVVLMKLRLNVSNQDLAVRFNTSDPTISRVFQSVLEVLHVLLKPLIHWPDSDELKKSMPMSFRTHFGTKVAVIIDCFEVLIERPSNLKARGVTTNTSTQLNI